MSVNEAIVQEVRQSYGRCNLSPTFYEDFYKNFFAKSPEIRQKFLHTDMELQKDALQHGLAFLILYAKGGNFTAEKKVHQLAESHSKKQHDISPHLYPFWVAALLETVQGHDKKCTDTLLKQWKEVLDVGIQVIQAGYNQ